MLVAYGADGEQQQQYYLGPIILAKDEKKDIVWVYDGQQRLTTLTIYMSALSQFTNDAVQSKTSDLSKTAINGEVRPRLDLRTRGGALTRIVRATETPTNLLNMPVDWRIYEIVKMFRSRFEELKDPDDFARWVQRSVTLNALWASNEQGLTLFDRANNRGVKLEWHELVKSVFVEALGPDFKVNPRKKISEFWYEAERETQYEFPDLILSAYFINFRKQDSSSKGSPAFESASALTTFENVFNSRSKNQEQLREIGVPLFRSLESYIQTAQRLHNLRRWDKTRPNRVRSETELIELQLLALEYPHWKAVLMYADEVGFKGANRLTFLKQLRRVAYTSHLLGWPNWSSRLDFVFNRGLDKMKARIDGNAKEGLDRLTFSADQLAQAKGKLTTSMSHQAAYRPLVKLWESELAFRAGSFDGHAHFLAHVEHILPQAPRGDWTRAFSDEAECAELIGKLGNFCLLSKEDNFELGDDTWARKRKVYKKASKCFVGARAVAKEPDWTPQTVKDRTQEIVSGIVQLLEL